MSLTNNRLFGTPTYSADTNPLDNQYLQVMHNVENFIITAYSREELVARHAKFVEGLKEILEFHTAEAVVTNE